MHRLRKFLGLRADDGWLLFKAWITVGLVRLGLWTLPYVYVMRFHKWAIAHAPPRLRRHPATAERIAWAITVAALYFPRARHCLTEGIATHVLLLRRGYSAQLRFGVAREASEGLSAHAWVESDGTVFIGDTDLSKYTVLPATEDPSRLFRGG